MDEKSRQKKGIKDKIPLFILYLGILCLFGCFIYNFFVANFLLRKPKPSWISCVETVGGIKVAQEMYISDEGVYSDNLDRLAMYMIPGCTNESGADCPGEVYTRGSGGPKGPGSCKNIALISLADGYDYEITATARDRYECKICMTPKKGYYPERYMDCSKEMTLTCPE